MSRRQNIIDLEILKQAAKALHSGQLVVLPTESVYGLAVDATNADAVEALYRLKGRPAFNPLIVHLADIGDVSRYALLTGKARRLAEAFWPGPLTLVLPQCAGSPLVPAVTAGLDTVAIRVPAHPVARALLKMTGLALAAPSANRSGLLSPTRAEHVRRSFGKDTPMLIDGGLCQNGLESTIIGFDEGGRAQILRPGPIDINAIEEVVDIRPLPRSASTSHRGHHADLPPKREESDNLAKGMPLPAPVTAPGQLLQHYAPHKPLALDYIVESGAISSHIFLIGLGEIKGDYNLSASGDLHEAAANLFNALHIADESDKSQIAIVPIPDEGIGAAILDRLRRAAHK